MKSRSALPLVCPCLEKSVLVQCSEGYICRGSDCYHSKTDYAFPIIDGTPVLISNIMCDTVCEPHNIKSYIARPTTKLSMLKSLIMGESQVTKKNARKFLELIKKENNTPKILVIGAGEHGSGTKAIWEDSKICVHGVDIYKSQFVDIVCDAHYLPLKSNYYDGIWIQAVLEHVVEPQIVVSEIHRVLKREGIIYAETPFMQQVHEGAYDFTRFTVLGHRYLFKSFGLIDMGGNKGAETVLAWSIRYFFWAIFRSRKLGRLLGVMAHICLRPFARIVSKNSMYDSSSGTYFLGKKSDTEPLSHKELITLYRGQF